MFRFGIFVFTLKDKYRRGVREIQIMARKSEYLGSSLKIEEKNGYSGTEESIIFAGAV